MDDGTESDLLHQTIAAGLSELGMPDLPCRSTTFLIHDGHCVGRRFLFDGVQAVWLIAENVVQFYGGNGRVLKSVEVGTAEREAA
ncbi:hypothetical protein ACFL5Q_02040 [Planctomycetota bacterium]